MAGRYRIVKQLGSGGFGVVYHAKHESIGRDVAIKFLSPDASRDPVAVERFRREAYYSSSLRHPNTIIIHDYGQTEENLFYIVMELLEGQPLSKAIFAGGGLTLGRALKIGEQILRSLGEAHAKGLVHRDLKPENIFLCDLLGEKDFVKVLDFGLSKALTPDNPALTQEGVVFGTPLYMAPEQAYGEEVLPASDLFAFGLLLYEMLVGERPFKGRTSMEVLLKLTQEPLPRLPAPLADSAVQKYVDLMTEKEVHKRPESATEALPGLLELLNGDALTSLGSLTDVYVGVKRDRRAARKKPIPLRASPPGIVPEPAPPTGGMSAGPRIPAPVVGAQDLLGDLFAPEELAASMQQVVRAEVIASGAQPALGADAPGAVSINLEVARAKPRERARYIDHGAKTLITSLDNYKPSPAKEEPVRVPTMARLDFSDVPTLGREDALNKLDKRGVKALKGFGGLALIEGEAGIGKTRVLHEFQRLMLRRGAAVYTGTHHANAIGPGTGLREAIERLLRIENLEDKAARDVVARRLRKLGIPAEEFVHTLMRALRPGLTKDAGSAIATRANAPMAFRVLERLLIREARKRPLVILIEDLHWADPFALGFAEHLVQNMGKAQSADPSAERLVQSEEALPLLFVCTVRREAMRDKAALVGAVQRMGRHLGQGFMRLELGPLEDSALVRIVRHLLPLHPMLMRRMLPRAKGSPLYILELMRFFSFGRMLEQKDGTWQLRPGMGMSAIPDNMGDLLRRRVEQAVRQDPDRELLGEVVRLSSVLGVSFKHSLLESFFVNLGRPELLRKLNRVLEGLVQIDLLARQEASTGEVTYEFAHALIQESLSAWVNEDPGRSSYHEAAARAKEGSGRDGRGRKGTMSLHADVAHHWEAAGKHDRAIDSRLRSARSAEKSLDLETALQLYQQVEEELARNGSPTAQRAEVQLCLGGLQIRLGSLGPAEDMLRRASDTARTLKDIRAEGRAMTLMGKIYTLQSRHREALRCFRRATACLRQLGSNDPADMARQAEALLGQAEVARLRGELGTAEAVLRDALKIAKHARAVEVEAHCMQDLGRIHHLCGRLQDAVRLLKEAQERFDQCGMVIASASVSADTGLALLYLKGRKEAEASIRKSLERLEAAGEQILTAHARVLLGMVLRRGGDLDSAARATNQALSSFNQLQHVYGIAKATLLLGEIMFLRGDVGLAQNLGKQALGLHEKIGDAHGMALCLMYLGFWSLEREQVDQAEAQLKHAVDMFQKNGILLYRPNCQLQLGRVAMGRGKLEQAQSLFTEAYQEAQSNHNQEITCQAALNLGSLALLQGHLSKARGFFLTGLTVSREISMDEVSALLLFGLAWVETLCGNQEPRQQFMDELMALRSQAKGRDFYLRERVARIARAVSRVRGLTEADHYRRAALTVLQKVSAG